MIRKLQQLLLLVIVVLFVSQLGKHFWPPFAYISGIRVDYLSPTLFLSDICVGILFILWGIEVVKNKKVKISQSILVFVLFLILCLMSAASFLPALYGALKIVEMVFLGLMVKRLFTLSMVKPFYLSLSVAVIIESLLVFWQFISQESIGGIWYLLGERTFSAATIGISTVSLGGKEVLRAYGSFPHPNVLAFFMLCAGVFLAVCASSETKRSQKMWFYAVFICAFFVLLLTFSRVTILAFIAILLTLAVKRFISMRIPLLILVCTLAFVFLSIDRFSVSALFSEDLWQRIHLAKLALEIASTNLLFGIGINNHLQAQLPLQKELTPMLLQPVHNIYLLTLVQGGLIGVGVVVYGLVKTVQQYRKALKRKPTSLFYPLRYTAFLLFVALLGIGLVDHYFFTLQQGKLIATFLIALGWIRE